MPNARRGIADEAHFESNLSFTGYGAHLHLRQVQVSSSFDLRSHSAQRELFPYFKFSITDSDLHYITRLGNAGYNTAIVFSCHDSITARQYRQWT